MGDSEDVLLASLLPVLIEGGMKSFDRVRTFVVLNQIDTYQDLSPLLLLS
jgi:hypothetical protein